MEGGPTDPGPPLFREEQRLRQWWLLPLVAVPVLIAWTSFVQQVVLGRPFGDDPAPDAVVWVLWLVVGILLPVGIVVVRLETEVRPGWLRVRFWPFPAKEVAIADAVAIRPEAQRPLVGWGGYGYRRNLRGDVAFLADGKGAVRVDRPGGKGLVVGTQHPQQLAGALHEAGRAHPGGRGSEGSGP